MRYPVLKVIVALHYVLAAFAFLWLLAFVKANQPEMLMRVALAIGGLATVMALVAVAEVLKLLMDVEANTRRTASPGEALTASGTTVGEQASLAIGVGLVLALLSVIVF
jgi:hypothetical protein